MLIPEWKKWPRMFSQWAFISAGALQGGWLLLSEVQRASIPAEWVQYLTITIVVLGFIGRLIPQPKVSQ